MSNEVITLDDSEDDVEMLVEQPTPRHKSNPKPLAQSGPTNTTTSILVKPNNQNPRGAMHTTNNNDINNKEKRAEALARLKGTSNNEMKEPIVIKDEEFTVTRPTKKRSTLVKLLNSLAIKVFDILEIDSKENERDVRRIQICNKIKTSEGKVCRDWLEMQLPGSAISWNDLDPIELEAYFVQSLIDVPKDYPWYRVFLQLDNFLSHRVRLLIQTMDSSEDEEEEKEPEKEPERRIVPQIDEFAWTNLLT